MSATVDRTGERRLMKCGEYATIIRYGGCNDIDVKFDSGAVVLNKRYEKFVAGRLSNPYSISDRVGERRLMRCGEYATIIRYANASDIDVKFDSGAIICHKKYDAFLNGRIAKSGINGMEYKRVGERRLMNCGEYATIIAYHSASDIDVKFDNGEVASGKTYQNFKNGYIAKSSTKNYGNRFGERRLMKCGEYATIIRYGSSDDIDVQFDTGEVLYNRTYFSFTNGKITRPLSYRVGECNLMHCGLYGTIIKYGGFTDIDVELSSGDIINCKYDDFKSCKCIPDWFIRNTMKMCYYDSVLNDTVILMKDGTVMKNQSYNKGVWMDGIKN